MEKDYRVANWTALTKQDFHSFIEKVLRDERWCKKWGPRKKLIVERLSSNARYAYAFVSKKNEPTIQLSVNSNRRSIHVVLHELAHLLVWPNYGHGRRFLAALLYLMKRYEGTEYARAFREKLKKTGAL